MYGIHDQALAWISSYLSERLQRVDIKAILSNTQQLPFMYLRDHHLNRACTVCILNICGYHSMFSFASSFIVWHTNPYRNKEAILFYQQIVRHALSWMTMRLNSSCSSPSATWIRLLERACMLELEYSSYLELPEQNCENSSNLR